MTKFKRNPAIDFVFAVSILFGTAMVLYAVGVPVEEYDGNNRRQVAEMLWNSGRLGSTWFDFGSILSLYLFYGPATLAKRWLHLQPPLSDVAVGFHGIAFVSCITLLILLWAKRLTLKNTARITWPSSVALVLLAFFCNPVLFTSERYLIETPAAFYLLSIAYICYRNDKTSSRGMSVLLMPLAAIAILTRGPTAVFIIPMILLGGVRKNWSQALYLFGGMVGGIAASMLWNYHRYGSALAYSYGHQKFDANLLQGVYAFLISPGLGILTFYPLTYFGLKYLWQQARDFDGFAALTLLGMGLFTALFASWCVYNGGLAYGPRFMLPLLPILGAYGISQIILMKSAVRRWLAATALLFWGAYINFNAILMPPFFFANLWSQLAPGWEIAAEEKQVVMDFSERMQIFDPDYSHYLGAWSTFWERRDVWEIPFLKYSSRRFDQVFTLTPSSTLHTFSIISRGKRLNPWKIQKIQVQDLASGTELPFEVVGDAGFKRDSNTSGWTASVIGAGTRLVIDLAEEREAPFRVILDYGEEHDSLPYSFVIQKEPGDYFGGRLNSDSYVPFRRHFRTHGVVEKVESKFWILLLGVSNLLFALILINFMCRLPQVEKRVSPI